MPSRPLVVFSIGGTQSPSVASHVVRYDGGKPGFGKKVFGAGSLVEGRRGVLEHIRQGASFQRTVFRMHDGGVWFKLMKAAYLLALMVVIVGCDGPSTSDKPCDKSILFGRPNAKTGLTDQQCQPRCACNEEPFEAPEYTEADAAALLQWTLLEPFPELAADPYASPAPAPGPAGQICAVVPNAAGSRDYRLRSYDSAELASADGAMVTHDGGCGLCSTLTDLAVYMRELDLTTPVRDCGIKYLSGPADAHVQCLLDLGFTKPCAQIWYYNTVHTRAVCELPCFSTLGKPYQLEDGSLNECLQCDEDQSGPIFKAIAGRTRRNTGIASALCRPCSEVRPVVHRYP